MKSFKTLLATFSASCWLARAGVIHLDVVTSGDVTVDIESGPQDLQSENCYTENEANSCHQVQTQHNILNQYDVTLPYEVHRGFLSVGLTSNIKGESPAEDMQDDSSYVKFSNIPFAEPPTGSLRFKAPIPPKRKSKDVNEGLGERVCPQYQAGWVPKAFDFLNCYGGALNETSYCSFKDNWTDPIFPSDYPEFDGEYSNKNGNSRPSPQSLFAKLF